MNSDRHDTEIVRSVIDFLNKRLVVPNGIHIKQRPKYARSESIELNHLLNDAERGAGVINVNAYSEDESWLNEIHEAIKLLLDETLIEGKHFTLHREAELFKVSYKLKIINIPYKYE